MRDSFVLRRFVGTFGRAHWRDSTAELRQFLVLHARWRGGISVCSSASRDSFCFLSCFITAFSRYDILKDIMYSCLYFVLEPVAVMIIIKYGLMLRRH